jgi:hypothetical protein
MTSKALLLVSVAASVVAACGNYSNEDLEFMAAVPSSSQLAVVLPATTNQNQAELAADTHNGIGQVNSLLDDVLGLIDTVRSYEPTTRKTNERIWGPFPDSNNPGWQWQLDVTRSDATTFGYVLEVAKSATPDDWVQFLSGSFDAAGGAKQGNGMVTVFFSNLASAGFPIDPQTAKLTSLMINYQNYQTPGSPVSATLVIQQLPDTNGVTSLTFTYEILADGSGEIGFTLVGNIVPGPNIETLTINAQWLASGAGMATLAVVSGDGAGLTQVECWDASFDPTYNSKPWMTNENVGDPTQCPAAPTF